MHTNLSQAIQPEDPPALKLADEQSRAGNTGAAVRELRNALRQDPADWRLHNALGDALLAGGREEEAIGAFSRAFQLKPTLASACVKIGRAFFSRGLSDPALFWLRRAMEIDSSNEQGLMSLAVVEAECGCRERVASLLKSWVAADPNNPIRRHLAAAILGEAVPAKAPEEYVTRLFDGYAERFDESLAKLHYCGPQLIADGIAVLNLQSHRLGDVLDVGCGTGLVGEVLRPLAHRLVGVDLSENMLHRAAARGVYNELSQMEMISFMQVRRSEFHLITAADVLTYCGDLQDFCAAAAAALRPEGWLIIVLEALDSPTDDQEYRLNRSGRYSHHPDYVKQCLLRNGFAANAVSHSAMRTDFGRPVPTLLVAAQRISSD